jgi:hypothetical protein
LAGFFGVIVFGGGDFTIFGICGQPLGQLTGTPFFGRPGMSYLTP